MLWNSSRLGINIYLYLMVCNSDSYYWNFKNFKAIYGFVRVWMFSWCQATRGQNSSSCNCLQGGQWCSASPSQKQCCLWGLVGPQHSLQWIWDRVVLVDFDWLRKDGESRYPATLNPSSEWAEEVSPYGIMRKAHDIWQLDPLTALCNSAGCSNLVSRSYELPSIPP